MVDLGHGGFAQLSDVVSQAAFVDGSDLLQQDDRLPMQHVGRKCDVRREIGFHAISGDGGDDGRRAVVVSHVILQDQHRPFAALLSAADGIQVCEVDYASGNTDHSEPSSL